MSRHDMSCHAMPFHHHAKKKNGVLGKASKKNVELGLLAEIWQGWGLRGIQEPNLLSGNFLIV